MKVNRSISNGQIFEKLMEKVKNVSDIISYKDLRIKYFNSYSDANNNKKKKSNNRTREELEDIFDELSKNPPLFCQVEIQHKKNYKWKGEDGIEYIGEVEIIGFFDLNQTPIKEKFNIIKKEPIKKEQNYPPLTCNYSVYQGARSSGGEIYYKRSEGTKENSKYLKTGGGGIVGGALGAGLTAGGGYVLSGLGYISLTVAGGAALPAASVIAVGAAIGLGVGALFGLFS